MSHDKYFDLHITGIGYLNRAREVSPKRGQPFVAVAVNALFGQASAVQRTRFDCRVVGREAMEIVRRHMESINDRGRKVLVGFKLGDLYPETFTYKSGDKEGQTGVSLKARLLRIDWVKIDGETVYQREQLAQEGQAGEDTEAQGTDQPAPGGQADPAEVRLSKDDPDFEAKKARLKERGYRFDARDKVWRRPEAA